MTKTKSRFYSLLAVTAFILTIANPNWHFLDLILTAPSKDISNAGALALGMIPVLVVHCIALAFFAAITYAIIIRLHKFYLGHELKDSGKSQDEIIFYMLTTMFVFGICLIGAELSTRPHQDAERDLKQICNLLSDAKLHVFSTDNVKQEINDICFDPPERP